MNRVNGHATLQIAETRYAIKCDYTPFMDWLHEACADFLVTGEPHAIMNLSFDINPRPLLTSEYTVHHIYSDGEVFFRLLWPETDNPDIMYRSMLRSCLPLTPIKKQTPDLWLHAAAVVYQGAAYIFTGPSGVGKSTICDILSKEADFTILHDEMVILSPTKEGFLAWSSPVQGQRPAVHRLSAPLRTLFFLNHSETNRIVKTTSKKAIDLLLNNTILTAIVSNERLVDNKGTTLALVFHLAEMIPCYELHFKPDFSFWAHVERALEGQR